MNTLRNRSPYLANGRSPHDTDPALTASGESLYERVTLHGVTLHLPPPNSTADTAFIGQESLVTACEAAWATGLAFALESPPGNGKTTLAAHLAQRAGQPLYTIQGHEELTPEDLVVTARISGSGDVEYVGSPLLAAMMRGGVALFDEIAKAPARALATLVPVLDDRRSISSVLAGITVRAHPSFKFCATLNPSDSARQPLPDYIDERLRPLLQLPRPDAESIVRIVLNAGGARADVNLLKAFREWLSAATEVSPRAALKVFRYATALLLNEPSLPANAIAQASVAVMGSQHGRAGV